MKFNYRNGALFSFIVTGLIIISSLYGQMISADPILLYDASGKLAAEVDTVGDSSSNVFLSTTGEPVGYVYTDGAVYSYSGKHLGWYSNGVFRDNKGYVAAFSETNKPHSVQIITETTAEPVILKQPIPAVSPTREVITTKPAFVEEISPTTFRSIITGTTE